MAENNHPGRTRALGGFAVVLLLTVAMYWKLVLTDQYTWLEGSDLAYQVLPWIQYQAGEWQQGRFPLWAPFEWGGQPLAGQAQPSALYPPNWLLYLYPLKNGWIRFNILNGYYVLLHAFAGWFMFLLCRDLGSSFFASVCGGMLFAYGGYVGTVDWPQMINGAIWAPLIFLFHLRAVRGISQVANSIFSGFFLGVSWLSGHHQVPIFLTLALGSSCCWFLYRRQLSFPAALATGALAGMVGAMQIFPAYEYGRLAKRWVGLDDPVGWKEKVPYFLHQRWGFFPISVFGIVIPGMHLNTSAFLGVAGLTLALTAWRDRIYFGTLAAGALLYALAPFGAIEGLYYSLLPVVEKARAPSMAAIVFSLSMAPLAAAGIDRLGRDDDPLLRKVLAGAGAALLVFYFIFAVVKNTSQIPEQRPIMSALAALTVAALLSQRDSRIRWGFAALIFIELSWMGPFYFVNRFDKGLTFYTKHHAQNQDLVDYLRTQPQPVRIVMRDDAIPLNFGDWYGIDVFGGYLASLTTNLTDMEYGNARVRQMMGVTHFIGKEPLEPGLPLVFRGTSGANIYAMPDPMPRVWTVHTIFRADTTADTKKLIQNPSFDLRQAAVTKEELPLERCAGDRTALLRHDSSRVVIGAEMACRGLLILGDVDFPGWRVRVDGRGAPLLTVNGLQRGVVVDPGWHAIEFVYRPRSVYFGMALTVVGTMIAAGASIMKRRLS